MGEVADRAQAADDALQYPHPGEGLALRREYDLQVRDVRDAFAKDLKDNYLADVPTAVAEKVFRKAWDDRHSEGYWGVEDAYEELAEIVDLAMADAWRRVKRS
jgi:hypothetical protein